MKVEDLLKIKKSVVSRKPTLIEIYEFNAFTNLMSLVLNMNKKKTLMSIQETWVKLIQKKDSL
jgi:hypothetical protein